MRKYLSAVGHAALEMGLAEAARRTNQPDYPQHQYRIADGGCLETPGRQWDYLGDARIDGVVGTGSARFDELLDVIGSKTGKQFPTGHTQEVKSMTSPSP